MNLLLDTHALLWFLLDDPRLSPRALQFIEPAENQTWVSVASLWEIAIKVSIQKIDLARSFDALIPSQLEANSIGILPIKVEHLVTLTTLPMVHRDPFDRLLVAQAISERFDLISGDSVLDAYPITRQW